MTCILNDPFRQIWVEFHIQDFKISSPFTDSSSGTGPSVKSEVPPPAPHPWASLAGDGEHGPTSHLTYTPGKRDPL